jgi:outer membrane beta-barrel protein
MLRSIIKVYGALRCKKTVCRTFSGALLLSLAGATIVHAQSEEGREPASELASREPAAKDSSKDSDDEYAFSWLDPDKNVYVLQNRKFRKARRFAVFASGGINLNNPYRSEYPLMPKVGYWFTEQFGVELFYTHVFSSESSNLTALKKVSASALPFVRQQRSYYGALFSYTPWYAKMNFFNKILYFDWAVTAGAGQVNTAINLNNKADGSANLRNEAFFAGYIGLDQKFFITRNFLVRWDLIALLYRAKGADLSTVRWQRNFDFTLGAGVIF